MISLTLFYTIDQFITRNLYPIAHKKISFLLWHMEKLINERNLCTTFIITHNFNKKMALSKEAEQIDEKSEN